MYAEVQTIPADKFRRVLSGNVLCCVGIKTYTHAHLYVFIHCRSYKQCERIFTYKNDYIESYADGLHYSKTDGYTEMC